MVFCAPGHPLAHGRPVELVELAAQDWILREAGSGTRRAIDRHLLKSGHALNVKLSLGSNEAIRDLVATGMGLVLPLAPLGIAPLPFGTSAGVDVDDEVYVIGHGGRGHALKAEIDSFTVQVFQIRKPRGQGRRGLGNAFIFHNARLSLTD